MYDRETMAVNTMPTKLYETAYNLQNSKLIRN